MTINKLTALERGNPTNSNGADVATAVNALIDGDQLINDLSQAYEFATVAAYKNFDTLFPDGKTIKLLDRGAEFTVITGTGTANTFNIIESTSVNQSIDLIIKGGEGFAAQFGYSNTSTTNAAILNHMFSLASVTNVRVPAGIFDHEATVTIPNNKDFYGAGNGFASNIRTKISYIGPDGEAAFLLDGFYTRVESFTLDDPARLNSAGIKIGTVKTRHYITDVTITGFGVGIRNSFDDTTFTHVLENVYIKDCRKALWFELCNNLVLKSCFLESNDIALELTNCNNVTITDGTALEIFGDLRLSETNTSLLIKAIDCTNIIIRDSYVEIGTLAGAGTLVQVAQLTHVRGFTYESNYHNRTANNMLPHIEFMDDTCSTVSVKNNFFLKGNSTGTDYLCRGASGFEDVTFSFDIANNAVKSTVLEKPVEFTVELREAGAVIPGITYSTQEATCILAGNVCTVNFNIVLSSNGTPAGGALTIPIPTKSFPGLGGNNEIVGVFWAKNLTAAFTDFSMDIESGGVVLNLARDYTSNLLSTHLTSSSVFRGSITFQIDRQNIL